MLILACFVVAKADFAQRKAGLGPQKVRSEGSGATTLDLEPRQAGGGKFIEVLRPERHLLIVVQEAQAKQSFRLGILREEGSKAWK